MRTKHVVKVGTILFVILFLALSGCTDKSGTSEKREQIAATQEKVVTIAISGRNRLLNFDAVIASEDMIPYELMYEPLVKYGQNGEYEPGLAEKWDISEDGKTYIFHLRQGVKFADGTDFNADAVLFNITRWQGKSATSSLSVANELTDITKLDDYTVKMVFTKSYYPFLTELSYPRPCRMLSPGAVATSGDSKASFVKPIGTGPWMLESNEDGVESVFVPNPYYYGEKPKVDKLVLKVISDPQSRVMALQSGEIDFSDGDIPVESLPVIKATQSLDILKRKGTKSYYLMFNQDNQMLLDMNVRRALNYAIDKESIVTNLFDGSGAAASGIFPTTVSYVTQENNKGYAYNLSKAKELLAASGYADSDGDGIVEKNGEPLTFQLVFQNREYAEWKPLCEFVQAGLKKAGIGIELQLFEVNAYYDAIWKNKDFDLIIYRTYEDSWNPHGFLTSLFYQPEGGKAVGWYDQMLNSYLDEVLATVDESIRQQEYDQIFGLMHDQAMCAPLYYPEIQYVYNKRLTGIESAPTSYEVIEWDRLDINE